MMGGIHFVIVMIGLFGLSEGLLQLKNKEQPIKQKVDKIVPNLKLILENMSADPQMLDHRHPHRRATGHGRRHRRFDLLRSCQTHGQESQPPVWAGGL